MKPQQPADTPIWPYVSVVACLFLLSVLAAESWQTSSRSMRRYAVRVETPRSASISFANTEMVTTDIATSDLARAELRREDLAALQTPPQGQDALVLTGPQESMVEVAAVPQSTMERESLVPVAEVEVPVADSVQPEVTRQDESGLSIQPEELLTAAEPEEETFATQEQLSEFAGPVAEQIQLDVSVAEKPVLPAEQPRQDEAVSSSEPLLNRELQAVPGGGSEMPVSAWPVPEALVAMLHDLEQQPHTSQWSQDVTRVVQQMSQIEELSSQQIQQVLGELRQLTEQARTLSQVAANDTARVQLLRVAYAIERRNEVWNQIHQLSSRNAGGLISVGFEDIEPVLRAANVALGTGDVARNWRTYLLMDEIYDANSYGDLATQRALARRVLQRLESEEWLSDEQREYLRSEPFLNLADSLRRWAREPINFVSLLDSIEAYELTRRSDAASAVAAAYQRARWSDNRSVMALSDSLNSHYRNANLRVAATAELINRLLPQPEIVEEAVDENILGAYVYGTSRTRSQLNVALIPDPSLWRIGLEASGEVESDTAATKGPATFYNQGYSEFRASKTLLVDPRGVKVFHAEAEADSETALRGFETEFDTVPVFGLLARTIARQKHNTRISDAQNEAEARLEERARDRLDEEVHSRLHEIEDDFQARILEPLKSLQLYPTALDMHTTDERLVIRYRIAGNHQLGAHTPRPQAPSDSVLSVQIHDTVFNNTIGQLDLAGRESSLRQLYLELADRFQGNNIQIPEDLPEGVAIRFASTDPIRLQFDDGRAMMTLRVAELRSGRSSWRNFAVRVYYVPDPSQLEANLVREGVIELAGHRLRLTDQIALRGIFSRVFSKNRPINVVNRRLARHPGMSDLQVTQFVISDGWIGVAMGPSRGTELQHLAREPSSTLER